jgi:hypothetical protein
MGRDMGQLSKKLEDLRTLETLLWTVHRERAEHDRITYGLRSGETTNYARAAKALSELLDGIDDILNECVDAEAVAYATGQPWGEESATVTFGFILETLNENLSGDA